MISIEIIFLVVWIFLAWMVWKKRAVSRYLNALKTILLIAGISGIVLIVFMVGVMAYFGNLMSSPEGVSETAETIAFWIGFSLQWIFIIITIGGLVMFLIGRRKPIERKTEIGAT